MAKKIIYHCYGGAHSSVVAAAIHLGTLKADKTPGERELMQLNLFDRQTKDGHGQLHFYGYDEKGRQVYSIGCRNAGAAVEAALTSVAGLLGVEDELHFVDTLPCVNLEMRIGGYISRRLGLTRLGRPLVVRGTKKAYRRLVDLVLKTKQEVGQ